MSWFETCPSGRILNRFTFDCERLDIQFCEKFVPAIIAGCWTLNCFVVMVCALGPVLLVIIALGTVAYLYYMNISRKICRETQRLDAISRSPIQSFFLAALDGAATIRAFDRFHGYSQSLDELIDSNARAVLAFNGGCRWTMVRTDLVSSVIYICVAAFSIFFRDVFDIDAAAAGLLAMWIVYLQQSQAVFNQFFALAEACYIGIERICEYCTGLPQEDVLVNRDRDLKNGLPPSWPTAGHMVLKDVEMSYRPGLPLALRGVNFTINPGDRVAVVGRSGAGKSTLSVVLFRIVEPSGGSIIFDGVDITTVSLPRLRKSLGIITQEAVVFEGSVRYNIDPFNEFSDNECIEMLKNVDCFIPLDRQIDAGEISVGQRQLLCLARALFDTKFSRDILNFFSIHYVFKLFRFLSTCI